MLTNNIRRVDDEDRGRLSINSLTETSLVVRLLELFLMSHDSVAPTAHLQWKVSPLIPVDTFRISLESEEGGGDFSYSSWAGRKWVVYTLSSLNTCYNLF